MSRHGVCFDNGMSGNCNAGCEIFQAGQCDAGEEVATDTFYFLRESYVKEEIEASFEPVKLFTLRGSGSTELELFIEALGY